MNLKIDVWESPETADFTLLVQAYDNGQPIATLASIALDDPNLHVRLRDVFGAYRMGILYGQSDNAITHNGRYGKVDAVSHYPDVAGNGYPEHPAVMAGSELPPRGEGVEDTSVIRYPSGEYPVQHHAK